MDRSLGALHHQDARGASQGHHRRVLKGPTTVSASSTDTEARITAPEQQRTHDHAMMEEMVKMLTNVKGVVEFHLGKFEQRDSDSQVTVIA